eukprot:364999-Chlamydomonas_euryale.AAC.36
MLPPPPLTHTWSTACQQPAKQRDRREQHAQVVLLKARVEHRRKCLRLHKLPVRRRLAHRAQQRKCCALLDDRPRCAAGVQQPQHVRHHDLGEIGTAHCTHNACSVGVKTYRCMGTFMGAGIHAYMGGYVHVCTHACTQAMCGWTNMHAGVGTGMQACMCACMHIYMHAYMHKRALARMPACFPVNIHQRVYAGMHWPATENAWWGCLVCRPLCRALTGMLSTMPCMPVCPPRMPCMPVCPQRMPCMPVCPPRMPCMPVCPPRMPMRRVQAGMHGMPLQGGRACMHDRGQRLCRKLQALHCREGNQQLTSACLPWSRRQLSKTNTSTCHASSAMPAQPGNACACVGQLGHDAVLHGQGVQRHMAHSQASPMARMRMCGYACMHACMPVRTAANEAESQALECLVAALEVLVDGICEQTHALIVLRDEVCGGVKPAGAVGSRHTHAYTWAWHVAPAPRHANYLVQQD